MPAFGSSPSLRGIDRRALLCGGAAALSGCATAGVEWRDDPAPPSRPPVRVRLDGLPIIGLQTGWVQVKASHRAYDGPEFWRRPAILFDSLWTAWLPIHCWVVGHPEGAVMIDAGETAAIAERGYADCDAATSFVYRNLLRFAVRPEDEAAAQLVRLGIDPERIERILLTHGHSDHMGGLYAFPAAQVDGPAADLPDGEGVLGCRFERRPYLSVVRGGETVPITRDGALSAIGLPGHSRGHRGALLRTRFGDVLFAGDAAFDQDQIRQGEIAGASIDRAAAARSLAEIRALAAARPTVVLPTHDPRALDRLAAFEAYA